MRRQWCLRRQTTPYPDGQQRWDRAYHLLLQWSQPNDGVTALAQLTEDPDANCSVSTRFHDQPETGPTGAMYSFQARLRTPHKTPVGVLANKSASSLMKGRLDGCQRVAHSVPSDAGSDSTTPACARRPSDTAPGVGWIGCLVCYASPARELHAGVKAALPLALSIVPFMAIFGVLMHAGGFSPLVAQAMSVLVFAGSQLVAAQMLLARQQP